MIKCSVDRSGKGWFIGRWSSGVPVALGYADVGVHDPHAHDSMYEMYPVARGTSEALLDGERVELRAGDLLVVEAGEVHTFISSSDDYFHFVVQAPFVDGDKRTASRRSRTRRVGIIPVISGHPPWAFCAPVRLGCATSHEAPASRATSRRSRRPPRCDL